MSEENYLPIYTSNKDIVGYLIDNRDSNSLNIVVEKKVYNENGELMGNLNVYEKSSSLIKVGDNHILTGRLNFNNKEDPYKVIKKEFNSSVEELNKDGEKRLSIVHDKELNKDVLKIVMKRDRDLDGAGNKSDRQRTEFKVYDKSKDSQKGFKNEEMVYDWKFKLGNDIKSVSNFYHIMQLKCVNTKKKVNGHPFFVVSFRNNNLCCKLEEHNEYIPFIESKNIVGKWIRAIVKIKYSNISDGGKFHIQLIDIENNTMIGEMKKDKFDCWRDDSEFVRPKWGLYRSTRGSWAYNKIDTIYFADNMIYKYKKDSDNVITVKSNETYDGKYKLMNNKFVLEDRATLKNVLATNNIHLKGQKAMIHNVTLDNGDITIGSKNNSIAISNCDFYKSEINISKRTDLHIVNSIFEKCKTPIYSEHQLDLFITNTVFINCDMISLLPGNKASNRTNYIKFHNIKVSDMKQTDVKDLFITDGYDKQNITEMDSPIKPPRGEVVDDVTGTY